MTIPAKSTKTVEDQFEEIMEQAILKAERVKCSIEEFREGLKQMESMLRTRVEMEEVG